MPNRVFMFGVTVLAVVIIIGGVSWTLFGPGEPAESTVPDGSKPVSEKPSDQPVTESPDITPEPSENPVGYGNESSVPLEEQARDAALAYMRSARPATAQFMTDLSWRGGRLDTGSADVETYVYYASDWEVRVEWPLVANPAYKVTATYSLGTTLIVWEGSYQNGTIKETRYSFTR